MSSSTKKFFLLSTHCDLIRLEFICEHFHRRRRLDVELCMENLNFSFNFKWANIEVSQKFNEFFMLII